jgi:hypothetical protein
MYRFRPCGRKRRGSNATLCLNPERANATLAARSPFPELTQGFKSLNPGISRVISEMQQRAAGASAWLFLFDPDFSTTGSTPHRRPILN